MALYRSGLIRLLESLRSTDGIDLIRAIAERMVQELIEAGASAHIGAEWNEHTPTRTTVRNGHREKVLTTPAGDLERSLTLTTIDTKPRDRTLVPHASSKASSRRSYAGFGRRAASHGRESAVRGG